MGCHDNIKHDKFPKQGAYLNKRVTVCFHYDTKNTINGTVVRDDVEKPGLEIIKLDNGNYVLTTECQWHPLD